MTALEVKNFFKYLWDNKVLIAFVMLITGCLDLVGILNSDFGAGFVIGFLMLFVMAIFKLAKK
jgi:hypothetical protein